MEKQDLYKIFAIGLVAVFVFEGIAIGLMSSNRTGNGGQQGTGSGTASVEGTASANVTIVRYEPYLIVKGSGPLVEAAKQRLIDSGIATYAVPSDQGLIINLKSSKSAPAAAAEFEKANATVYVNAAVATQPKVKVEGSGITTTVDGASFSMQMRPLYEEGAVVPATFSAQASDGQLVSISSFSFLPTYVQGAVVKAELVSSYSESYLEVPWEARAAARESAQNESNATYKERSYILLPQNAAKQQLDAAFAAGSIYMTGVQAGLISVKNDFVDRSRAEQDIRSAGIEPSFPVSTVTFADANASGRLARGLSAKIQSAGYPSAVVLRTIANVRLPQEIRHEGRAYQTGGLEFSFEQKNGTGTELEIGFEATGNKLARLTFVRQLAAGPQNATNSTG